MIFFKTLRRANSSMVAEAAAEIAVIAVLCLLPLVGVAFNSYLHQPTPTNPSDWRTFMDFTSANITKGQLAFYAISNWATALWLCAKEYKNIFPWRIVVIVLGVLGFYYCGVLIDPSQVPARAQFSVFATSTGLYLASMASYFLVALYSKIGAPSTGETNAAEVETLRQKLKTQRAAR